MNKKYSAFRKLLLFVGILFSFVFESGAQEIIGTNDHYYYNNFENGQLGTAFTQMNSNVSLAVTGNASANNLATGTGYSVSSTGSGLVGGLMMNFIPSGTNLNNETYGYEWSFLYRNSGGNTDNSDVISPGENTWNMWFLSEGLETNNTRGYYLTQEGSMLYLRYRYSNSSDASQYNNLISFNLNDIGGNGNTYAIRVQRLKRSNQYVWHLFIDRYSETVKEAFTERGGTGAYNGDQNLYRNSRLILSSTSAGRFKFDEFKFYSMKLELSGANSTANGISNPLFAGQQDAILYGMSIKTRGYFDIYQINFNLSGNITSIVEAGTMKLMRSVDNQFGSVDDYYINDLYFYNQAAQNYTFFDRFWSIGESDGNMKTVGYYFIKANIKSNASTTETFSFVGAPVLQSSSAQINYVANGDVTNTVAPPAGSGIVYDWLGGNSANWNTPANWSPVGVPGDKDVARIGVNVNFSNHPTLSSGTQSVGNVTIGTRVSNPTLTVNGTLNVVSTLKLNNAANANFSSTIAGTGVLNVENLILGDNIPATTASATANTLTLTQTLNNLNVTGALVFNGAYTQLTSTTYRVNNPIYQVQSGKNFAIHELRSFNVNALNKSTLYLNGGNLKITGTSAMESISGVGQTYVVTPSAGSSLVEYASLATQKVYTNRFAISNLPVSTSPTLGYSSIKFSGNGQKMVQPSVLDIKGSWVADGGKVNLISNAVTVNFTGQNQTITDNGTDSGLGLYFWNVNFTNGTKTLSGSGKFAVAEKAVMNVAASTQLNTAGLLTMKSSASGFASVGTLSTGTISGNAHVEVYFTGGVGKRGTRMFAPPINESGMRAQGRSFYQQMKEHMVITGAGDAANGFDPGNGASAPTLQKYNEAAPGTGSQFIAIASLLTGSVPNAIPGEGFFFAYRGNRNGYDPLNPVNSPKLSPTYVPESFSPAFTGTFNRGNISVTINNSNNANDPNNGYNVVGNPYVATIDWEKVFATNSAGMDNEIKIITPGGAIMTRKKVGSTVTVINGNAANAQYIQPGQAFYVKKNSAGSKTFTFAEAHKVISVAPARYLSTPTERLRSGLRMDNGVSASNDVQFDGTVDFRIILSDADNSDETALIFKDGYQASFDQYDSSYLGGSTVSLSSFTSDNRVVAINYLPEIGTLATINLRTTVTFPSADVNEVNATLRFPNTIVLGEYDVILNDSFLNTTINVRENPVYNFTFTRNIASSTNRFSLSFVKVQAPELTLASFETKQMGNLIQVDWKTSKERSSLRFEVETSTDGTTFNKVGSVAGAGDASIEKSYTFNIPNPQIGLNYIRLKQVYYDGTFNYSAIVQQEFTEYKTTDFSYIVAAVNKNVVNLSWETLKEVNTTKFVVEQSTDELNYTQIGELVAKGSESGGATYQFAVNTPEIGLNAYRLKIENEDGQYVYSEVRVVNYFPSIDITNFKAQQVDNSIAIDWTSLTERDADTYTLEKSVDKVNFIEIANISASGPNNNYQFVDQQPQGTKNYYRLKLSFLDKSSSLSEVIDIDFIRKAFVEDLKATVTLDDVTLTWLFTNLADSKSYEVERSTDGINYSKISDAIALISSSSAGTFVDANPVVGRAFYRIKHIFNNDEWAYSNFIEVIYREAYKSFINNFELTGLENAVQVSWSTLKEEQSLKFGIERSDNGIDYVEIGAVTGAGDLNTAKNYQFVDNNPIFGLVYYRLKHDFTDGTFSYTDVKSIDVKKVFKLNLSSFTAFEDGFTNKLYWETVNEEEADRFEVEKIIDGNYLKIAEMPNKGNATTSASYSYIDVNPITGLNVYRLKQIFKDGTFDYSAAKPVTHNSPLKPESFVENLRAVASLTDVTLTWTFANLSMSKSYEIERSTDGILFSKLSETISLNETSGNGNFVDLNPVVGRSYYRVKHIFNNNDYAYSNVVESNFREAYKSYINSFELTGLENAVKVNWSTLREEQSLKFGLERSGDGINYVEVSQIAAAGNTDAPRSYEVMDTNPIYGVSYYRLKHYFTDGTSFITPSKAILVNKVYQFYLASFNGFQDGFTNKLFWETVKEEASVRFEIERLVNNNSFIQLGSVNGAMNSSSARTYSFVDIHPKEGDNVYRLKQIYSNGSFRYSEVRTVNFIEKFEFNLSSFDVTKANISAAEIKFVIKSERNGRMYEIQRSLDGFTYSTIGQLAAVGSPVSPTTYTFMDLNPFKDKAYYRIKYTNNKLESQTSYPQLIDFGNLASLGIQNLNIFPNPATDFVEVNVPPVPTKLNIFNLAGQLIKQANYDIGERNRMNVSDLKPGMYILELQNTASKTILGSSKFYKNL